MQYFFTDCLFPNDHRSIDINWNAESPVEAQKVWNAFFCTLWWLRLVSEIAVRQGLKLWLLHKMCSTPTSDKTTTSSSKCNTSTTEGPATTSKTAGDSSTQIKTTSHGQIQEENSGENFVNNNNNNNHRNTGKTSSTTCAKNKQVVLGQSGFQDVFSDAVENGKLSSAFGSSTPVSSETSDAATTTKSADGAAGALLTTSSIGLGRLAAGSRLAPGNQAIFGGGGGGKGTTGNAVSDSAVYSKTGEDLIDNYGSDNAIISSGGSNPLTKRRNTKATVKRNQSKFQVPVQQQQQQQQQQPNNSKGQINRRWYSYCSTFLDLKEICKNKVVETESGF